MAPPGGRAAGSPPRRCGDGRADPRTVPAAPGRQVRPGRRRPPPPAPPAPTPVPAAGTRLPPAAAPRRPRRQLQRPVEGQVLEEDPHLLSRRQRSVREPRLHLATGTWADSASLRPKRSCTPDLPRFGAFVECTELSAARNCRLKLRRLDEDRCSRDRCLPVPASHGGMHCQASGQRGQRLGELCRNDQG